MEPLPSPGEDFYRALAGQLACAPLDDAAIGVQALRQARAWRELGPAVRAIFSAAAAKFLSE